MPATQPKTLNEYHDMTLRAKTFWLLLLCLTLGASIRLPVIRNSQITQPPPKNTNTYGLFFQWTPSFAATGYKLYVGDEPTFTSANAVVLDVGQATTAAVRLWATNTQPWAGVTAYNSSGESSATLLTKTNYYVGQVVQSPSLQAPSWSPVDGTAFVVATTNASEFFMMQGSQSNNMPIQP